MIGYCVRLSPSGSAASVRCSLCDATHPHHAEGRLLGHSASVSSTSTRTGSADAAARRGEPACGATQLGRRCHTDESMPQLVVRGRTKASRRGAAECSSAALP